MNKKRLKYSEDLEFNCITYNLTYNIILDLT